MPNQTFRQIRLKKDSRGVALLMALFSITLLTFLAMELSFDSIVEYKASSNAVNRLQAYYAAKSGAELGLLRVKIYKKALKSFGDQLGANKSMLDPIWNFPFAWPPSQYLGENISRVDRELIQDAESESLMEAQYIIGIESEGKKIDINDLGSSSEALAKATRAQMTKIFQREVELNEQFSDRYRTFDFQRLLNNIADWIDGNTQSRNGGTEASYYPDIDSEFIPPNQAFKTLQELNMVADMNDELYSLLKDKVTVYGVKGININQASSEILRSLDPQMTQEIVSEVVRRRQDQELGGPFTNEKDFFNYLGSLGVNTSQFNQEGVPLLFGEVTNFRITSTGVVANVTREIELVTFDMEKLKTHYADFLAKQDQTQQQQDPNGNNPSRPSSGQNPGNNQSGSGNQQTSPNNQQSNPSSGRPRVVYWNET